MRIIRTAMRCYAMQIAWKFSGPYRLVDLPLRAPIFALLVSARTLTTEPAQAFFA